MAEEPIQIKHYPNRRFNARNTSKYVTVSEIEEMIRQGDTIDSAMIDAAVMWALVLLAVIAFAARQQVAMLDAVKMEVPIAGRSAGGPSKWAWWKGRVYRRGRCW